MTDKVLLAFSGGLDTSVCVKLLEEKYNVEVITACVDVGQGEEEMEKAKNSAANIGGLKHYNIDAKEEFANEYIARGIKANAEYELNNEKSLDVSIPAAMKEFYYSVKNADFIIVLENGQITEQGTHKELLEKQGYYYKIYRIQQGLAGEDEIAAALEGGAF